MLPSKSQEQVMMTSRVFQTSVHLIRASQLPYRPILPLWSLTFGWSTSHYQRSTSQVHRAKGSSTSIISGNGIYLRGSLSSQLRLSSWFSRMLLTQSFHTQTTRVANMVLTFSFPNTCWTVTKSSSSEPSKNSLGMQDSRQSLRHSSRRNVW